MFRKKKLRQSSSTMSDEPAVDTTVQLQREIGLPSGCAIICGIIIGSGIFISPRGVVDQVESVGMALLVWFLSGVLSMIGALCYAELGTAIPRSGGDYEYIRESLGNLPSFLYLWSAIITIMPAGNAVIALTFANYILKPFYECDVPLNAARLLAGVCLTILTFLNCWNVKLVTRIQSVFTATKLIALLIIIIAGLVHIALGNTQNFESSFATTKWQVGAISKSFYSGLFSYAGWNYLNFLTEEVKNPYKNLPRAIWISMPLVILVYTLANVAYFAVLTVPEITQSPAVAVDFANKMFGPFAFLMPFLVACSTFGAVNGTLLSSSRLFFIGSRNGHLPDLLALVNINYLTPIPAILCVGILSLIMLVGDVIDLLNYAAFVEAASQTMCVAGLLYLRYSQPNLERPIKVNIILPIIFLIVGVFLFFLPIPGDPWVFGTAIFIVLLGIPVYLLLVLFKRYPVKCVKSCLKRLTVITQCLTYSMPEERRD